MKITRRLSVLLAVVLLFALVPAAAFADNTGFTQVYLGDSKDYKSESSVTIELGGGTVAWDAATATVTLTNVKADCGGIDIRRWTPAALSLSALSVRTSSIRMSWASTPRQTFSSRPNRALR